MFGLTILNFQFYFLAILVVFGALGVIAAQSPIYSVLSLALSMIAMGGMFFTLGAYFVAAVQLIVYAGAVLVLFVMVIMLFDLNKESGDGTTNGLTTTLIRAVGAGAFLGLIYGALELAQGGRETFSKGPDAGIGLSQFSTVLFSKYLFAFEIISVLLLVVAVGAVVLARSKGGTHA